MYTSSLDAAAFPPGIPVARVKSFHAAPAPVKRRSPSRPIANLTQLAYVDVVVWEPPA
jgi:cell shape-determining protein MreC